MRHLLLGALAVAVSAFVACATDSSDDAAGTGGTGAHPGTGGSAATGGIGAGTTGGSSGSGDAQICAAESHSAEPTPIDIYILLDQSTSMANELPNGQTLWEATTAAISAFLKAPQATGIGVGIQYFGLGTAPAACNVGQYATPEVPIAELPGVEPAISASLAKHAPQSFTPTGAALQGGLEHAKSWAAAHPDRTTILLLATDGYPTECEPQSMTGLGELAAAALNGDPRVFTFVIGIGSLWNLHAVAEAGGTREAVIISDQSASAAEELTNALLDVATAPLACDYAIPTPADGGAAVITKVNVEFTPSNGPKTPLVRVMSAADCAKVTNGWYYDNPSAPTRIIICPNTCTAFGTGKLDILLGCDTNIVT